MSLPCLLWPTSPSFPFRRSQCPMHSHVRFGFGSGVKARSRPVSLKIGFQQDSRTQQLQPRLSGACPCRSVAWRSRFRAYPVDQTSTVHGVVGGVVTKKVCLGFRVWRVTSSECAFHSFSQQRQRHNDHSNLNRIILSDCKGGEDEKKTLVNQRPWARAGRDPPGNYYPFLSLLPFDGSSIVVSQPPPPTDDKKKQANHPPTNHSD